MKKNKVAITMSGEIDSSVAVYLLSKEMVRKFALFQKIIIMSF